MRDVLTVTGNSKVSELSFICHVSSGVELLVSKLNEIVLLFFSTSGIGCNKTRREAFFWLGKGFPMSHLRIGLSSPGGEHVIDVSPLSRSVLMKLNEGGK